MVHEVGLRFNFNFCIILGATVAALSKQKIEVRMRKARRKISVQVEAEYVIGVAQEAGVF